MEPQGECGGGGGGGEEKKTGVLTGQGERGS